MISPETLSPGDTADVIIKKRNPDGTLEDFPPEQMFEIGMIEGCDGGMILVDTTLAVYFEEVMQPIKFVAADSLESDSGYVRLRVGTDVSGYMSPVSNNTGAEEKQSELIGGTGYTRTELRAGFEKMMEEKKAARLADNIKTGGEPSPEAPIIEACALDQSAHPFYWEGDVSTGSEPELIIIYPNSEADPEVIVASANMPTVICKAILKNYNKGQVTYEWIYRVSYEMNRRYKSKSLGRYINICAREGKVILRGTSYSTNSDTTYWNVSFNKNDAESIEFKAKQPEISVWPSYGGDCDEIITTWDEGEDIFIGGYVTIEVTAKDQLGNVISSVGTIANRILGENPEPDDVYTYANSLEIEAILRHESISKQFATNNRNFPMYEAGWPKYGPPNGYGLMQLDNPKPATEKQMWNWKSNLDAGSDLYLNEKKPEAKDHLDEHKPYEDEIYLKCAFQRYNYRKHFLYQWDEEENKWIINEDVSKETRTINGEEITKTYGEFVWDIYQDLIEP